MAQAPAQEIKHIIRIVNTDLDGHKPIKAALRSIKGVGFSFSGIICTLTKIDKHKQAGFLTEEEIKRITDLLHAPAQFNIPVWMLNHRRDYETGLDNHLVGIDLDLTREDDFKRLMRIKARRGLRHSWHLPVRGQRTRSNFRPNKGKVIGVKRRKGAKAGRV